MITLLLGADDFSKQEYISSLAQNKESDLVMFSDPDSAPGAGSLLETDLFSRPKIFVLKTMLAEFGAEEVEKCIASPNHIIFSINSLDKRKKENKELLANKKIIVKDFSLPHGRELNDWIIARVKSLGGNISHQAADALAVRLGRDNGKETKIAGKIIAVEEVFNLWQADGEIKKLLAFGAGNEIGVSEISELVSENGEVDVFDLTNAIADNQKQKAMDLLQRFLKEQSASDEKGAIIQLNALLGEQFRNVAMIQDFVASKKSEDEILEATGWKSGRLFVIKKIATKFPAKKIIEFLNKLEALDEELKTSGTPPRVVLDLIVSQLLT
jgi:DNA polymerase III delta subunit